MPINTHMAFYAKDFWRDPLKAKTNLDQRHNASGRRTSGPKMRVCYNCDDKFHFVAECPYERREDHNGRLVLKDKSKINQEEALCQEEEIQQEANKGCPLEQRRRVLNRRGREVRMMMAQQVKWLLLPLPLHQPRHSSTLQMRTSHKNINCFMARPPRYHHPSHPH